MQRNLLILSGLAALALSAGVGAPASASIVTYNLISGSPSDVLVTGTITGGVFGATQATLDFNTATNPTWTINLNSGFLTLDNGTPALDAFSFGDSSAGPATIIAGGHTLGNLSLTSILVQSTQNPDTTLTINGINSYGFNTPNVMDSAGYSFTPSGGSVKTGSVSATGAALPITGSIVTGGTPPLFFSQTDAIQLGTFNFTVASGALKGTYTVSLKGDYNFDGQSTVPLPPSVWLLASALGLLGFCRPWQRAPAGEGKGS